MQLTKRGQGTLHSPPAPNAPVVEALFGGIEGGPDLGVAKVKVPAASGMPPHRHGGSDVVIIPLDGPVEITDGTETHRLEIGDAILITKDEEVGLANPGDTPVEVLVTAGPANFVTNIRSWPKV